MYLCGTGKARFRILLTFVLCAGWTTEASALAPPDPITPSNYIPDLAAETNSSFSIDLSRFFSGDVDTYGKAYGYQSDTTMVTLTVNNVSGMLTVTTHTTTGWTAKLYGTATDTSGVTVSQDFSLYIYNTLPTGISLSVSPTTISEGGGARVVTVTAGYTNSWTLAAPQTVNVSLNTSSDGVDAELSRTTISMTIPGVADTLNLFDSVQDTVTVTPTDDDVANADGTVTASGTNSDMSVNSATLTIANDDTAGVEVSPTAVTVAENGGTDSYSVRLTSEPTSAVTVIASSSATSAVKVGGAQSDTLTFTTSNWGTNQSVSLTGVNDNVDNPNDQRTATISHAVSGGDYGSVTAPSVSVTITDDDTANLSSSVSPSSILESAGATVVTATVSPSDSIVFGADQTVTVTLSGSGASNVVGYAASRTSFGVTLTGGATSVSDIFTVTPTNDDVDTNDETITVSVSAAPSGVDATSATLTIANDDTAGVEVSPTAVTVAENGGTDSYEVRLTSEPTSAVTVIASSSATSAVKVGGAQSDTLTFTTSNWGTNQSVSLTSVNDNVDNPNDQRTATISHAVSGGDYGSVTAPSVSVTITDDDTANLSLSVSPSSILESAGATVVTATVSLSDSIVFGAAQSVSVTVSSNSGNVVGVGLSSTSFTVTLPADSTSASGTFTVTPTDDNVDTNNGMVTVSGSAPSLSWIDNDDTITITDNDDSPTLSLSVSPSTISEGADTTSVTATVTLSGSTVFGAVQTVTVTLSGSGASNVVGYSASPDSFTVTLPADSTSASSTFTVTPTDDNVDTNNETITVSGSALPSGVSVSSATITITDNDDSPTLSLSVSPSMISEGADTTSVTATVTLSGSTVFGAVQTVTVTLSGSGASNVVGYSASPDSFTVTLPADSTSASSTFTVTPTDDNVDTNNETITVSGSASPSGVSVTSATLTITDDDTPEVTITAGTSPVTEGTAAGFTISASPAPAAALTVDVSVSGASGFLSSSVSDTSVTIDSGTTSAALSLATVNDVVDEPDATLTAALTSGTGYTVGSADTAQVTIADDDAAPAGIALSVSPSSISEGDSAASVTVTASPTGGTLFGVLQTVSISVAGSGGGNVVGFSASPDTISVSIAAGDSSGSGTFTVTPTDDEVNTNDETLTVSGSASPSGVSVSSATLTIEDDDVPAAPENLAATPGDGQLLLDWSAVPLATSYQLRYKAQNQSPPASWTSWTDIGNVTSYALGSLSNGTTYKVRLRAKNDNGSGPYAVVAGTPVAIVVTISADADSVTEGASAGFTLTASPAPAAALTVDVSVSGALDFLSSSLSDTSVTIAAGDSSAALSLATVNDVVDEPDATLTAALTSGTGYTVGSADTAQVTIADDDAAPAGIALSVSPSSISEGDSAASVTVTASPTGGTLFGVLQTVSISVAGSGGGNVVGFSASPDTISVSIAAGDSSGSGTFTVTPTDDEVNTNDETLTVSGSASPSGVSVSSATLTIEDDDVPAAPENLAATPGDGQLLLDWSAVPLATSYQLRYKAQNQSPPASWTSWTDIGNVTSYALGSLSNGTTYKVRLRAKNDNGSGPYAVVAGTPVAIVVTISADADSVTEGASAAFTISASPAPAAALTVDVSVSGALDFLSSSLSDTSVTIAAGDSSAALSLATVNDVVDEPDATLTAALTSGTGYTVGSADTAQVTIADDDAAPAGIALSVSPSSISEGAGATVVTVTASPTGGTLFGVLQTVSISVAGSGGGSVVDFSVSTISVSIAAGDTSGSGTFTLTPTDDEVNTNDETLTVSGSASPSGVSVTSATLTITDDDTPEVTISADADSVTEGASAAFTISASPAPAAALTVDVSVSGASDFLSSSVSDTSVTIAAGDSSAALSLGTVNDNVDEPDATLTAVLTAGTGYTVGSADTAQVTIADDDAAPTVIALIVSPATISEGDSATLVSVTASPTGETLFGTDQTVTVTVSGSGGSSVVGFSASPITFSMTLPAEAYTVGYIMTVTPVDDSVHTNDETITLSGSASPSGVSVASAALAITDDDFPVVTISADASSVTEGASAGFTLTASPAPAAALTVDVSVSGALDFLSSSLSDTSVTIAAGDSSAALSLATVNDVVDEPDATLTAALTSGTGYTVGSADTAQVTIADDDAAPTGIALSVSPSSISEGDSAASVTVTASPTGGTLFGVLQTVSISVAGSGGGNVVGFSASPDTISVSIAAGDSSGSGTFTVTPTDDEVNTNDETLTVSGSASPSGVSVSSATLTIEDDDVPAAPENLAATPGDGQLLLDWSAVPLATSYQLRYKAQNQSPPASWTSWTDIGNVTSYALGSLSNGTTYKVRLRAKNDNGSGPYAVVAGTPVAIVVTISADADSVTEGASAAFTISASPAPAAALTVDVSVSGALDFLSSSLSDTSVTIAAGDSSAALSLATVNDVVDEPDATLTAALTSGTGYTVGSADTAQVTIADDDAAPAGIALSVSPSSISEGDSAASVTVTASPTGGTLFGVLQTVSISVAGSGGGNVVGFSASPDTISVSIAAGDSSGSGTFTVTPTDDEVNTNDETLTVSGSASPSGVSVSSATLTIEDDDVPAAPENLAATPGDGQLLLDWSAVPLATSYQLRYKAQNQSPPASWTSWTDIGNVTSYALGSLSNGTTYKVRLRAKNDNGSGPYAVVAGTPVAIVVTISADADSVTEGASAAFTISASPAPAAALTVDVSVSGALDFLSSSLSDTSVTIAAGDSSAALSLATVNDVVDEPDATLTAALTSGTGYTVGSADTAQVTIADDDAAPAGIALSVSPSSISEGAGATVVTVTASPTGGTLFGVLQTVSISVAGSGGGSVVDFSVSTISVSIAAGDTSGSGTFTLTPTDDEVNTNDETLTVSGSASPSGVSVTSATLTITDDDTPEVTISADADSVTEGASAAFTISASPAPAAALTVDVSVSGASDFLSSSVSDTSVTIAAGDSSAALSLGTVNDNVDEPDATLTAVLTAGTGYTVGSADTAQVTIADDDAAPTVIALIVSPATISEGDSATLVSVTASPTGETLFGTDQTVTVTVSGSGGSSVVGFSASPITFSMTLPAEAYTVGYIMTVTPVDDSVHTNDETITLSGSASPSGVSVASAALAITDDDFPVVTISADASSVTEGASAGFTLTASPAPAAALTVDVSVSGALDFLSSSLSDTSVTIAAGDSSAALSLATVNDVVDEPDATLTAALTSGTGYTVGSADTAQVTISDNDASPTGIALAASPVTISEGDSAAHVTVTASVTGGTFFGLSQTVTVTVSGSGDSSVVGFSASTDTIAVGIGAGTSSGSGTFTVTPVDDSVSTDDETITLSGSASPSGVSIASVTLIIEDDDVAQDAPTTAPDNLLVTSGDGELGLSWSAVALTETYELRHRVENQSLPNPWTWTDIDTVTSYMIDSLSNDTEYVIQLRGQNAYGAGPRATVTGTPAGTYGRRTAGAPGQAAPAVVRAPAAVTVEAGVSVTLDVSATFSGQALTYSVLAAGDAIAAAVMADAAMTVTGRKMGRTSLTVMAHNEKGSASYDLQVTVTTMAAERKAFENVLSAMGRGMLSSVHSILGDRFSITAARSRMTLAGRSVEDLPSGLSALLGLSGYNMSPATANDPMRGQRRAVGRADLLRGSSFAYTLPRTDAAGAGRRITLWGTGNIQTFKGRPDGASYDGDVRAGYLGVDVSSRGWMSGLSVSRNVGASNYDALVSQGTVSARLTSVLPYARWRSSGRPIEVWSILGVGAGAVAAGAETRDLSMRMGMLGLRALWVESGGINLSVVGHVGLMKLSSSSGASALLNDVEASVRRVRVGFEGSHASLRVGGMSLMPFVQVAGRHDGGDGETGQGIELTGGLRVLSGRVGLEARGRLLATHTATDYRERGLSLIASVNPGGGGGGLTVTVAPRWGADTRSSGAMWRDEPLKVGGGPSAGRHTGAVRTQIGYGLSSPALSGMVLTPFGEMDLLSAERHRLRLGTRLGIPRSMFSLELAGERRADRARAPDHSIGLIGRMRF